MKIMLDVNVAVDVLGATEDVFFSFQALDIMLLRSFTPCVAASAMPIIQYVLTARKYANNAEALAAIEKVSELVEILDVASVDCQRALANPLGDFEDAMLAWCANRHRIDLIVTRNAKDFQNSPVAVMTPEQFCEAYKPTNYSYDMAELTGTP